MIHTSIRSEKTWPGTQSEPVIEPFAQQKIPTREIVNQLVSRGAYLSEANSGSGSQELIRSAQIFRSALNPNQNAVSNVGIATRVVSPLNAISDHDPSAKK